MKQLGLLAGDGAALAPAMRCCSVSMVLACATPDASAVGSSDRPSGPRPAADPHLPKAGFVCGRYGLQGSEADVINAAQGALLRR